MSHTNGACSGVTYKSKWHVQWCHTNGTCSRIAYKWCMQWCCVQMVHAVVLRTNGTTRIGVAYKLCLQWCSHTSGACSAVTYKWYMQWCIKQIVHAVVSHTSEKNVRIFLMSNRCGSTCVRAYGTLLPCIQLAPAVVLHTNGIYSGVTYKW